MTAAREVEAERTVALVLELTADVPAVIAEAIEVEAVLVLALITAASEVEAVKTSDCVANEPESNEAPVRVLTELFQISETRVPTEESVLVVLVQTELANVVVDTIVAPTIKVLSIFTKSPVGTLPHVI
jgi:hypothetical protein